MTVTLSRVQKDGKFSPGEIVAQYLTLLNKIFSKEERNEFIFYKGIGSVGFVFEGTIERRKKVGYSARSVKIANKDFAIVKHSLADNPRAFRDLARRLKNYPRKSSFVLMEHTAKWKEYEGSKYWLDKYAPPRLTPRNNIFLPQGTIGVYFGYGQDKHGFYKEEKRGIKFAKAIKAKDYLTVVARYYGKFLDSNNLRGLATKKETGLRHFSMGIYNRRDKPIIFQIKSENIVGKQTILDTPECQIVCSHLPVAKALKNNFYRDGKLKAFPIGKAFELAI